ncbi:MAG: prohibitin family protein [Anaerolineales bacterium]|nr:prohibitin family protein [Anaerolineales bacterium]MCB9145815.1 prohibitin family protein [Anaerolineales bacterium]
MNIASAIQTIGSFAWIAFIGLLILMAVRASRNQPVKGITTGVISAAVAAILLTTIGAGLVFIQPEQRGIVVSAFAAKGYREQSLQPGLRWIIPFAEQVTLYPISRQTYTMSAATNEGQLTGDDSIRARTKDGQEVYIDASVVYQINPESIIELHINWQNRYQDELVRPASRNTIRDAVSQYGVEEIVSTKRAEMEALVNEQLAAKLAQNDLVLIDFLLRDIHFSDEYAAAVEQKQIAEQQAQQAAFVVEQKRQEAEQARQVAQGQADAAVIASQGAAEARLIEANAESEANRLLSESLTPELIQYQYILNLSPNVQAIFIPSDQQFILPLPDTTTTP